MLLRLLLSVRNTTYNSGGSLRIIGARVMLPHKRAPRPFDRISVVSEISCCAIGSNVLMLNVLPEWHFEDVWHRCPRSAILRHRHSSCGILIRMPQLHRLKFCCRGDGVHRRLRSRRPRLRLDGPRRARPVRPRRARADQGVGRRLTLLLGQRQPAGGLSGWRLRDGRGVLC
jgi:hypothetical protein